MVDAVVNRQAPFIENYIKRLLEQSFARAETPQDLPQRRIAGQDPITRHMMDKYSRRIQKFNPMIRDAAGFMKESAVGPTAGGLKTFMDPYQTEVTDLALRDMDREAAMAGDTLAARQVGQGAFGGTRGALESAELGRNLQDIKSRRIFGDRSANFAQAMQGFQNQQKALQNAGSLLGQTAQTGQSMLQNQGNFLAGLGSLRQGVRQQRLDANYGNQMADILDPYRRLGFMAGSVYGAPGMQTQLTSGYQPTGSPMSAGLGMGMAGLGAFRGLTGTA